MSDQSEAQEGKPVSKRGEAAWKETKDRIAERNAKTRSAGKQRREAHDRERADARRAADQRRMIELLNKSSAR